MTHERESLTATVKVALRMWLFRLQYAFVRRRFAPFRILTSAETVRYVLDNRCSVCRYGDGEMDMITSLHVGYDESRKSQFQPYDRQLAIRLEEVLRRGSSDTPAVLVCIPYVWRHPGLLVSKSSLFVRRSVVLNCRAILGALRPGVVYGDAYFTRFYIDFKDKDKADYVRFCRQIWEGRDVCLIEGEQSRLGVGNDLFANARRVERILCPAVGAFARYDEILASACRADASRLFLLALGQTATVLAYDLAHTGRQAIDIGHIDVEYEWMRMGATEKVALPRKFVNEVEAGRDVADETDAAYLAQIIDRIV